MSKSLGWVTLLLVALAALVPFFHADHHANECAVCAFAAAGNAQLTPDGLVIDRPLVDFCGLTDSTLDPYLGARPPVGGSRAPPTPS